MGGAKSDIFRKIILGPSGLEAASTVKNVMTKLI